MTTAQVDAIVLAAGNSSRLGQPKQGVTLHGETLLARTIDIALGCVDGDVHVILGADAETLLVSHKKTLEMRYVCPHVCRDWARGQNASLAFGLEKIAPERAVLVLLVDQYRVQAEQISDLIRAWRSCPDKPAAASYANTCGVPVLWPAHYVERLRAASRGRSLLNPATCTLVPLPAAAYDLDTPEHLLRLREFERAAVG